MASAVGDTPTVHAFDYGAVGEAVESRRQELNLTPSGLIRSIDWLSAAPLARLRQGGTNTCQHVNGLLRWLGRAPRASVRGWWTGRSAASLTSFPCRQVEHGVLWEAVDALRTDRGQSWDEVRGHRYSAVDRIRV